MSRWASLWIQLKVPAWANFKCDDALLYLGVWLGPGSGKKFWNDVLAKWMSRSFAIVASAGSPMLAIELYNSRAASCTNYLSQIAFFSDGSPRRTANSISSLQVSLQRPFAFWDVVASATSYPGRSEIIGPLTEDLVFFAPFPRRLLLGPSGLPLQTVTSMP